MSNPFEDFLNSDEMKEALDQIKGEKPKRRERGPRPPMPDGVIEMGPVDGGQGFGFAIPAGPDGMPDLDVLRQAMEAAKHRLEHQDISEEDVRDVLEHGYKGKSFDEIIDKVVRRRFKLLLSGGLIDIEMIRKAVDLISREETRDALMDNTINGTATDEEIEIVKRGLLDGVALITAMKNFNDETRSNWGEEMTDMQYGMLAFTGGDRTHELIDIMQSGGDAGRGSYAKYFMPTREQIAGFCWTLGTLGNLIRLASGSPLGQDAALTMSMVFTSLLYLVQGWWYNGDAEMRAFIERQSNLTSEQWQDWIDQTYPE